jgi:hypothetical protein
MANSDNERHRRERGVILELLVQAQQAVAFTSLWRMMDGRGFTVTIDGLLFHLANYLEPQGYITLTRARDLPGWQDSPNVLPSEVISVKIAPKGIQVLNRSIEDPEVVI